MKRALVLAIALGAEASANPFEVEGLTSRYAAMANTGAATADDPAALYYNPAGLVLGGGASDFEFGTVGARAHLNHAGKLPDPLGVQLAVRAPLPLRGVLGGHLVVGIALHLLPRDVAHVIAPAPEQVYYPYYGDRLSRIVVLPGIAARFGHVAVGAAVDVLAGLTGDLTAAEGATRALDARADERIPTIARALVGASWQLTPCLRVGAVFRQKFEMPIHTIVAATVAGEPIDLDIAVAGQFAPHQLTGGVAYRRGRTLVAADLRYARWSDYRGPFVVVSSQFPLVGDVPALSPRVPFSDTLGARAGIEAQFGAWTARAGYGYETSPVPAKQTGVTNLLDGPRHTLATGLGRTLGRLRIDAHVQMQLLQARVIEKQLFDKVGAYDPFTSLRDEDLDADGLQITNPGFPKITASGQVISAGLTLAVPL